MPNGHLASVSEYSIKIWNLKKSNSSIRTINSTSLLYYMTVLPNNNLVTGDSGDTLVEWDYLTGKQVKSIRGFRDFSVGSLYVKYFPFLNAIINSQTSGNVDVWVW